MKGKQKPDLKEEKMQVTFYCPVAVRDKLKRIAFEEDRELGQQIVKALRDWLDTHSPNKLEVRGH